MSPDIKVIADMVINHRFGITKQSGFKNPDCFTYTIVNDNEWGSEKFINKDLGPEWHKERLYTL